MLESQSPCLFQQLYLLPLAFLFTTVGYPPVGVSPAGGQGNGGHGKVSKWAILAKAEKFVVSPLHQTIRLVTQITSK